MGQLYFLADKLIEIFSTRELAILSWVAVVGLLLIYQRDKNGSLKNLLQSIFNKTILIVFSSVFLYSLIALSILLFANPNIASLSTAKLFTVWFLFTAIPSISRFSEAKSSKSYINSSIRKVVGLSIITDLLHEISTFNYFIEVILVGLFFFLGFSLHYSQTKKGNNSIKKFSEYMLLIISLVFIGNFCFKIYQAKSITDFSTSMYDLLITIYLSIFLVPLIVFLSNYSRLQQVYLTVNNSMKSNNLSLSQFIYIFGKLNYKITNLERWRDMLFSQKSGINTEMLFTEMNKLLRILNKELLDIPIPFENGWSSEKARSFLKPIVSEMGFYKEIEEGSWFACSDCIIVPSDNFLENNIAYHIEGNSELVNQLKIVGNMNSKLEEREFFELFNKFASKLFEQAFNCTLPNDLAQNLKRLRLFNIEFKEKRVSLTKNTWSTGMGYNLNFIIESPPLPLPEILPPIQG